MIRENNPPLFYSMLHVWKPLWGTSKVALRLLPIAGGLAGIALVGIFCLRYYGRRAAIAAIILLCFSAQHIYFSDLLRGYIFAFDGVAISLLGLVVLCEEKKALPGSVLYISGSVLAIHSHTTMFIWPAVATIACMILFGRQWWAKKERTVFWLAGANLLILLLSGWWLYITIRQLQAPNGNIAWIVSSSHLETVSKFVKMIFLAQSDKSWISVATMGLIALSATAAAIATWNNIVTRLVAISCILAALVFWAVGILQPIITTSTVFWLSLFPTIVLAGGIGSISARSRYVGP